MKNLFSILILTFVMSACQPNEGQAVEQSTSSAVAIGQSWTFIDDNDVRAEWQRLESSNEMDFIPFEMRFTDRSAVSQTTKLEVTIRSRDRVFVKREINADGISCQYEGRIWTETDLESYSAFTEDPDPNKRPVFYHIVTGTYSCDGMTELGTWAAKINE